MFRALVLEKPADPTVKAVEWSFRALDESALPDDDVTVRVEYSTVNYKDGLAVTGRSPVVRRYPMVPGIDFAGVVETSRHPSFQPGDRVAACGCGMGETHWGGYSEKARVPAAWLVPLAGLFSTAQAMAIGTAGYTAMLSVQALERLGITPTHGEVLVTGAAGGVGSVAVALLAKLGYRVVASTGRAQEAEYLTGLGAAEIIGRDSFAGPAKPLEKERWAGVVDTVGSHTLAHALAQTRYNGVVAACGLAQGMDLPGSVAPFILRGATLVGIDSVMANPEKSRAAWARLGQDLDIARLEAMTNYIGLSEVPAIAETILAGQVRGRTVVDIAR